MVPVVLAWWHFSLPLISLGPPLILPRSGCLLLQHADYQALLCVISILELFCLILWCRHTSETRDLVVYHWEEMWKLFGIWTCPWAPKCFMLQYIQAILISFGFVAFWVFSVLSIWKFFKNYFYQGEILMYNKWMTITIWKYYSLCGNQLQISAYSQRQHLNTEYHWQEVARHHYWGSTLACSYSSV